MDKKIIDDMGPYDCLLSYSGFYEKGDKISLLCWGKYWDDCDETNSIGIPIIISLIDSGRIKGTVYVEGMSQEYGVDAYDLKNKDYNSFPCEVIPFDEKAKSIINRADKISSEYDNIICIVKDDPRYSLSEKEYSTTSIVVKGKEKQYVINIAYPEDKEFSIKPNEFIKKLKKTNN